jgi:hypothetical protein
MTEICGHKTKTTKLCVCVCVYIYIYIYIYMYYHSAFFGIAYKKEVRFDSRYGTCKKKHFFKDVLSILTGNIDVHFVLYFYILWIVSWQ